MFLAHLILGLLLLIPFIVFGIGHIKNSYNRPNRRAVRVGYALFVVSLVLLFSGVALMRVEGFEIKNPNLRSVSYLVPCDHATVRGLALCVAPFGRASNKMESWIGVGRSGGCSGSGDGCSTRAGSSQIEGRPERGDEIFRTVIGPNSDGKVHSSKDDDDG